MNKGVLLALGLVGFLSTGCAREAGKGVQSTSGVSTASAANATGLAGIFSHDAVSPSSPYGTLDLEHAGSYDESFSLAGGFGGASNADGYHYYWYVNWIPASDSASPILTGLGLHTLDEALLVDAVCALEGVGESFDLYAVVAETEWNELDQRSWTSNSNFVFWDWEVTWNSSQCTLAKELLAAAESEDADGDSESGDREQATEGAASGDGGSEDAAGPVDETEAAEDEAVPGAE